MKKVCFVFGTRPEAIKMAPVILHFREMGTFEVKVCVTGQHREMLNQVLDVFGITPDINLDLMQPDQSLSKLTGRAIEKLDQVFREDKPDLVLVQGDTTTVFCAALSAFYNNIPIGHIEAGLRTGNLKSPWPEEANRILTTRIADLHFAPTVAARQNLIKEGICKNQVFETGNTVVDALLRAENILKEKPVKIEDLPDFLQPESNSQIKMVLVTSHRRESYGGGFERICKSIRNLAENHSDVHFVFPVHLNPNVQEPVNRILGNNANNIHLITPQPYLHFVGLMLRSYIILTDSGGIQEEAPSFGKPVLVMRDTTERPEAINAGSSILVGTNIDKIVSTAHELLTNTTAYNRMANVANPYGDGKASIRVHDACKSFLGC